MLNFLNECHAIIEGTNTYADLALFIVSKVKVLKENFGPEIIILSELVYTFQSEDIPITHFDRGLLLIHIERQIRTVEMFY